MGCRVALSLLMFAGCGTPPQNTQPQASARTTTQSTPASQTQVAQSHSSANPSPTQVAAEAPRGDVNIRVIPQSITVVGAAVSAGSALSDGRSDTGISGEQAEYVIRLSLGENQHISALAAVGTGGELQLVTGAPEPPTLSINSSETRWQRTSFEPSALTQNVELRWHANSPQDRLAEIELWARRAPDSHLSGSTLRDEIATNSTRSDLIVSPTPRAVINAANRLRDEHSGTFEFSVTDPRACSRAFLRYSLTGVQSWTSLVRRVNDSASVNVAPAIASTEQTVQVEELMPSVLRVGANRVQFDPVLNGSVPEYRVENLSVVCVRDPARRAEDLPLTAEQLRAVHALQDGSVGTGLSLNSRDANAVQQVQWNFAVPTQLHEVALLVERPFRGSLNVTAQGVERESHVRIPLVNLQAGWNRIAVPTSLSEAQSFTVGATAPREANATVSELVLSGSPLPSANQGHRMVLTTPDANGCVDASAYVRGFVESDGIGVTRVRATVDHQELQALAERDGTFSLLLPVRSQETTHSIVLTAELANGETLTQSLSLDRCRATPSATSAGATRLREDVSAPYGQWVHPDRAATLNFGGTRLEIDAGSVAQTTRITVRPLESAAVPPLDPGMTNVTAGGRAYRFGPHGMQFAKPVRLSVDVDSQAIPAGMRAGDVSVFYYDEAERKWRMVTSDGAPNEHRVASVTNHFTDYIAATLASPDAPQAGSVDMNTISGIQAASPTAGVTAIPAPGANSSGVAATSFPIVVPPGRAGMQPDLAIQYNSRGDANSWLGVGWDLSMPVIEVDTRFGVPEYNGQERYLLNGAAIVCEQVGEPRICHRRIEGSFDRIARIGAGPNTFRWEITTRDGTKYYYGETQEGRLAEPEPLNVPNNIGKWFLQRVVDIHGNQMVYHYWRDLMYPAGVVAGTAGEPWVQLYPSSIEYTSHINPALPNAQAYYTVEFQRDSGDRLDVMSSARLGFDVRTRFRLSTIVVRANGEVVRQIKLNYELGDFSKTLLKSIEQYGQLGSGLLYRHQFEYHRTPTVADGILNTPAPIQWSDSVGDHQMNAYFGNSGGGSMGVGFGFPFLHLHLGVSGGGGGTHSGQTMVDVDGDGLPDFMRTNHDDGTWPIARTRINPPGGGVAAHYQHGVLSDPNSEFSDEVSASFGVDASGRGIFSAPVSPSLSVGVNFDWHWQKRRLMDVNGDGWIDMIHGPVEHEGAQQLAVYLNPYSQSPSGGQFGALGIGGIAPNYYLGGLDEWHTRTVVPPAVRERLRGQLYTTDPLFRWRAQYRGWTKITGAIHRQGPGGGDGVRLRIFRVHANNCEAPSVETVWDHTLSPTDADCVPAANNACGNGLDLYLYNGDRLYFQTSAIAQIAGDLTTWNPSIKYTAPPDPCVPEAHQQPSGTNIYSPQGQPTNDPGVCVLGIPARCTLPWDWQSESWTRSADFRLADSTVIGWAANARGHVALTGTVTMSGPGAKLTVYRRRTTFVDGNNQPIAPPWDPQSGVQPTAAQIHAMFTDPQRTTLTAFAPLQQFTLNAGVNVIPAAEYDVLLGDQLQAVIVVDGDPAIVQQTALTVTYQQMAMDQPGMPAMSMSTFDACAPGMLPGSPVMCPLHMDPQGRALPESAVRRSLIVGISDILPWPVQVGSDTMRGWYRGWSYGEWNGNYPAFSEAGLQDPSTLTAEELYQRTTSHQPIPAFRSFPLTAFQFSTTVQGPTGDQIVNGPGWRGTGLDSYITATQLKPSRSAAFALNEGGALEPIDQYQANGIPATPLRASQGWDFSAILGVGFGNPPQNAMDVPNASADGGPLYGASSTELDFYDFNGDRLPDSIRYTDDGGKVQLLGSNNQFSMARPLNLHFNGLRHSTTLTGRTDFSFGSQSSRTAHWRMSSGRNLSTNTVQASGGTTNSGTVEDTTVADINGDGLPDHLRIVPDPQDDKGRTVIEYQLNLGSRLSAPMRLGGYIGAYSAGRVTTGFNDSSSVSLAGGAGGSIQFSAFGFFSVGGSYHGGTTKTEVMLVDVTGDGLPDHVRGFPGGPLGGGVWLVAPNLGSGFGPYQEWRLTGFPEGLGRGNDGAIARTSTHSFTLSAGAPLRFSLAFAELYLEPAGNFSHQWSDATIEVEDINGDGLADQVARADDGRIFARLSPVAAGSNLLKTIISPLNSRTELQYEREGNQPRQSSMINGQSMTTYMPRNEWVLKTVRTIESNERVGVNGYDFTTTFDYHHSGNYDPDERESYGFAWVTATNADGSHTDSFFNNQNYYRRGQLLDTQSYDPAGHLWSRTRSTYTNSGPTNIGPGPRTGSLYPRIESELSEIFDGTGMLGSAPRKSTTRSWQYDANNFASDIFYANDEGTADDIHVQVSHVFNAGLNRWSVDRATVFNNAGVRLQERTATFRPDGTLETMTDLLQGGMDHDNNVPWSGAPGNNPSSTFTFDAFGNLASVTDAAQYVLSFTYDAQTHSHVVSTSDSFGATTTSVPNLLYGNVASMTDANGSQITYQYDLYGRLVQVRGPRDLNPTEEPTIAIQYSLGDLLLAAPMPFALTRHKDSAHPGDPIETATFADGFGRPFLVKREVDIDDGVNGTSHGFVVNGQTTYDVMGRVVQQAQPTFNLLPANEVVPRGTMNPTVTSYDAAGRVHTVTTPDGAVTLTDYGFEMLDGVLRPTVTVTDAMGRSARRFENLGGSVLALRQQNHVNGLFTELWTKYRYDTLGRLDRIYDPNGNKTDAEYDSLGRMTALRNPDSGWLEYRYNRAGELRAKITPNLRSLNQAIVFNRDRHRLLQVTYPNTAPTTFAYGPTNALDPNYVVHSAGRLTQRTDSSGSEWFTYGDLGEVTASTRTLNAMDGIPALNVTTRFTYDSFNRLRTVRYNENEIVTYSYDHGGALTSVRGQLSDGAQRDYVQAIRYDLFGHRVYQRLGNGVETRYNYDPIMQRLSATNTDTPAGAGGPIQRLTYQYNSVGNVVGINTPPTPNAPKLANVSQGFFYDDLDQLTYAWGWGVNNSSGQSRYYSLSMGYDGIGNIQWPCNDFV